PEALHYCCASLRLASFWAADCGMATRWEAERQQLHTLASLLKWASHPDQTSVLLRTAVRRVQAEIGRFPTMQETLAAEYRLDRTRLEDLVQHGWGGHANAKDESGWLSVVGEGSRYLPWER